jgi:hypothetical protein
MEEGAQAGCAGNRMKPIIGALMELSFLSLDGLRALKIALMVCSALQLFSTMNCGSTWLLNICRTIFRRRPYLAPARRNPIAAARPGSRAIAGAGGDTNPKRPRMEAEKPAAVSPVSAAGAGSEVVRNKPD